jgi:flagellar biosynthetic protein FliR
MDSAVSSLLAPGSWPAFVLITARLSGLMLLSPFWSMVVVPRSVKGAIVVVLAAIMTPLTAKPPFPDQVLGLPIPLMMEFTIGLAIGVVAAVVSHAMMLASEVVAFQTGLSLGQILTPNIELGGPALGQIYGLFGLAVFVATGGPTMMLEAIARSLVEYPPGTPVSFAEGPVAALTLTGAVFGYAVQIAAPIMVALTITNIAMAILSRAVPQLNAMAMSFSVTLGVGLVVLGLSLPLLTRLLGRWIEGAPAAADALLDSMIRTGAR